MTAACNGHISRLVSLTLVITGLAMVNIAGCKSSQEPAQVPMAPAAAPMGRLASGADTPIVISGGSIHFRATKKSDWTTCDGKPPAPTTICYEAPFNNKADLVNYQFVNEDFVETATPVTSSPKVANGWEIDVIDANPDNQHMILICAEISSDNATCDHGPIHSQYVYIIAKGTNATFDMPKGPGKRLNRIVYRDGDPKYDYVANILLNASGGAGGQQTTCTDGACNLFLSK